MRLKYRTVPHVYMQEQTIDAATTPHSHITAAPHTPHDNRLHKPRTAQWGSLSLSQCHVLYYMISSRANLVRGIVWVGVMVWCCCRWWLWSLLMLHWHVVSAWSSGLFYCSFVSVSVIIHRWIINGFVI